MRRRAFHRTAGTGALFAPFLSLLGRSAAQPSPGRAKYLCLMVTTGHNPVLWEPGGALFNASNMPLARLADDVVLVSGLDGRGTCAQHGSPGGLSGRGYSGHGHTSIEQRVAEGLLTRGVQRPFGSLLLGGDPDQDARTFLRDGDRLGPIASPLTAFGTLFSGAAPDDGEPMESRLMRRQSILDLMLQELEQLRSQLGAEEAQRLEAHAESIRDLERRLAGEESGAGAAPERCVAPTGVRDRGSVLANNAASLDLGVTALGCDLTRVVAVDFGYHNGTPVNLPGIPAGDWHGGFLHSRQDDSLRLLEAWLSEQLTLAMEKAKRLPDPEGDGTLYDHTLFVWARSMGDAVAHRDDDMRCVFAGGAGGYLRRSPGGRHLDAGGAPHERSLRHLAAALGVEDVGDFGDPSLGGEDRMPLDGVSA